MPARDLPLLSEAARAAGEIALRHWRNAPRTWEKDDGAGPVTEADLAVDALLRTMLTGARPDYGWLSEESPDDGARLRAERVFIVDPIDGTRAYVAGERTFAHSLAVAEAGRITAAVVYLPALDKLYMAAEGGTATLNGQPVAASHRNGLDGATLLTARPNLDPRHWQDGRVPPVRREFRASLAFRLCLVAEGRFDAMLSLKPTWEWDVAAGSLIAERAGARVGDAGGRPIAFNRPDARARGIVAAPPPLWRDLVGALVPLDGAGD